MNEPITPEFLEDTAFKVEREELKPRTISRRFKDTAEHLKLLKVREAAYERQNTDYRQEIATLQERVAELERRLERAGARMGAGPLGREVA